MEATKNIFEETVKSLNEDALSLQKKFKKLQENNDFRGAIDCMRLMKDTLSLIKEYDWQTMYSEYKTDGYKEVAVWEQNHCGEIRNHKKWEISDINNYSYKNRWYKKFRDYIVSGKSCLIDNGLSFRDSGKSYSLAKLCSEYDGCVIVKDNKIRALGIQNNCEQFDFKENICTLRESYSTQFKNKIFFIDENSGLSKDEIQRLKGSHLIVGFIN